MNFIDLMVNEHKKIKQINKIMRIICLKFLNNEDFDLTDFDLFINFIKEYADKHHHGKEEKFYFNEIEKNLGELGVNLIRHGMLVEHDLGRLYIMNLEKSLEGYKNTRSDDSKLDIIANTISYGELLERHINKEDDLVYTYGIKNLSKDILNKIEENCKKYELDNEDISIKYLNILKNLETKYL